MWAFSLNPTRRGPKTPPFLVELRRLGFRGFFKKVKYGGGDNLTLFSRQTPPVSVQNAEKHLCSSEIRYG